MNKKLVALGLVGTLGIAGAVLVPLVVAADDTTATSSVSTFVQKLAAKLGIDQGTVQSAVNSVKTDIKAEHDAQVTTEIAQAVADGKLTQRQADILTALQGVQLDPPSESTLPDKTTFDSLTQEERQAQMEANRTAREQSLVDKLNESGLNTTVEELTTAREAARAAGIRVMGFGMGRGGFGEGMGRGMMGRL